MRSPHNSKTRILVVDDDVTIRGTISRLLQEEGYEVTTAVDGFDALLSLQEEVPDLILSDLNKPQMSGFELLSVVRQRFPKVMVVASSGAYESNASPTESLRTPFMPRGSRARLRFYRSSPNWCAPVLSAIKEITPLYGFLAMAKTTMACRL